MTALKWQVFDTNSMCKVSIVRPLGDTEKEA